MTQQPRQLLVLQNALDYKIDVHITTLQLKKTGRRIAINISHITSIKLEYTEYDDTNKRCYVITLVNNEKIYVNEMIALPIGFFSATYSKNCDYEVVDTLTYTL